MAGEKADFPFKILERHVCGYCFKKESYMLKLVDDWGSQIKPFFVGHPVNVTVMFVDSDLHLESWTRNWLNSSFCSSKY